MGQIFFGVFVKGLKFKRLLSQLKTIRVGGLTALHLKQSLCSRKRIRWFLSWALVGLFIVLGFAAHSNTAAFSQIPTLPQSSPSEIPNGVVRQGWLEITGIKLGGKEILKIASPAVFNRTEFGSQIPVEVRSHQIEANLEQLLSSDQSTSSFNPFAEKSILLDPNTIQVFSETLNSQPVLFAKDAIQAEPRVLLTITDTDAQYYVTTKNALVITWQRILEQELRQALELRKPGAFKQQANNAALTLAGIGSLTILLLSIRQFLERRNNKLKQYLQDQIAATTPDQDPVPGNHHRLEWLLEQIQHQLNTQSGIEQRLQVNSVLRWLVFWAIIFIWVTGTAAVLYLFPQTRPFAQSVISTPVLILIAWFITGLANRLANLAIDQFIKTWEKNTTTVENSYRRSRRVNTTVNALKGLVTVLIYFFGAIWVLQTLNMAPASLLAFGTLLALAISFGVQNIIKDLVNGVLILMEDQYAVGDYIVVGLASGIVENVNLRVTQIRADDGRLITLPNSLIAQVDNLTRTWSRSDFLIDVAYNTDIDQAMAIILQEVQALAQEPAWEPYIFNIGEVFGVEKISHEGISIRLWIKTFPLKQWAIARELRRRLKIAFDRYGIQIGIPQQMLSVSLLDSMGKPLSDRLASAELGKETVTNRSQKDDS